MDNNSTFFEKNRKPFKFFIQAKWLSLSRVELFLLDKQAKYSVKEDKVMCDKIYVYLQAVSNIKEEFLPLLQDLHNGVDIQDKYYKCAKESSALWELVETDFEAACTVQQ